MVNNRQGVPSYGGGKAQPAAQKGLDCPDGGVILLLIYFGITLPLQRVLLAHPKVGLHDL